MLKLSCKKLTIDIPDEKIDPQEKAPSAPKGKHKKTGKKVFVWENAIIRTATRLLTACKDPQ